MPESKVCPECGMEAPVGEDLSLRQMNLCSNCNTPYEEAKKKPAAKKVVKKKPRKA